MGVIAKQVRPICGEIALLQTARNDTDYDVKTVLAFLYLSLAALIQGSKYRKRGGRNARCWIVLCKKLPEWHGSEPR